MSPQNNRKNLVPSPVQRAQFKRFFGLAAKIMEGQLLSLTKNSLKDFMDMVVRAQVNRFAGILRKSFKRKFIDDRHSSQPAKCKFHMDVIVSHETLGFHPSFDEFKTMLCGILDRICKAVTEFNTLETQLYLDWSGPLEVLKVNEQSFSVDYSRGFVN